MRFADKLEARVKPAVARRVRAEAKLREETPAAIIREALEEYFARREAPQPQTQAAQLSEAA